MSSSARFDKKGFFISLYHKLYSHPSIVKVSEGHDIVIPKDKLYEFLHDLGVLVEESFKENTTLEI